MVRKTVEKFYSDLSGDEITEGTPTTTFVFDGVGYEVDLTDDERRRFEEAMAPYVAIARRATRPGRRTSSSSSSAKGSGVDAKAVREWAQEQGLDVPARGRVPASLIEAYQSAH